MAGLFSQSPLAVQQHPAARDEAIKDAWLRPDGLSLRIKREGEKEEMSTGEMGEWSEGEKVKTD